MSLFSPAFQAKDQLAKFRTINGLNCMGRTFQQKPQYSRFLIYLKTHTRQFHLSSFEFLVSLSNDRVNRWGL